MLKVGEVKEVYELKGVGRSIRGIADDLGIASIGFPRLHRGAFRPPVCAHPFSGGT